MEDISDFEELNDNICENIWYGFNDYDPKINGNHDDFAWKCINNGIQFIANKLLLKLNINDPKLRKLIFIQEDDPLYIQYYKGYEIEKMLEDQDETTRDTIDHIMEFSPNVFDEKYYCSFLAGLYNMGPLQILLCRMYSIETIIQYNIPKFYNFTLFLDLEKYKYFAKHNTKMCSYMFELDLGDEDSIVEYNISYADLTDIGAKLMELHLYLPDFIPHKSFRPFISTAIYNYIVKGTNLNDKTVKRVSH